MPRCVSWWALATQEEYRHPKNQTSKLSCFRLVKLTWSQFINWPWPSQWSLRLRAEYLNSFHFSIIQDIFQVDGNIFSQFSWPLGSNTCFIFRWHQWVFQWWTRNNHETIDKEPFIAAGETDKCIEAFFLTDIFVDNDSSDGLRVSVKFPHQLHLSYLVITHLVTNHIKPSEMVAHSSTVGNSHWMK